MNGTQIPDFSWEAEGPAGEGVEMAFLDLIMPAAIPAGIDALENATLDVAQLELFEA